MSTDTVLLLDAGNSRVKWACLDARGLHTFGNVAHRGMDLYNFIGPAWEQLPTLQRVVAANVAGPALAAQLTACTGKLWALRPEFIGAQPSGFGVTSAYHEPDKLGADRWAALVGARYLTPGGSIIIDCGTAITVDALSNAGIHLGGVIVPGLGAMRHTLATATHIDAALSNEEPGTSSTLTPYARTTAAAVRNGTLYAAVAALDRILQDMTTTDTPETCIITGGDAVFIQPLLARPCRHEAHLVLQGLAIIARGDEQ